MNYTELFQKAYEKCEIIDESDMVTVCAAGYDRPDLQLVYEKMQLPTESCLGALQQLDARQLPRAMGYACTKELVDLFKIKELNDYAEQIRVLAGVYDYVNAAFYVDLVGLDAECRSSEFLITLPNLSNDTALTVACGDLARNLGVVYHNRVRFFVLPLGFAVSSRVSRKALNTLYLENEDAQLEAYRQITLEYARVIASR